MKLTPPLIAIILSFVFAHSAAAAPIYLKAGATGTGDGSSWANACSNLTDAVAALNASEDAQPTLKIAQGYVNVKEGVTITVPNFVVRGGYRAESDGDEVRDPELYRSILSAMADSQYWAIYNPDVPSQVNVSPTAYVFVNGKLTYPDASLLPNERSFFVPSHWNGARKLTILKIDNAATSGLVADVTLACVKDIGAFSAGSGGTIVSNCLFTAMKVTGAMLSLSGTSKAVDCVFRYNASNGNCAGASLGGSSRLEGCVFDGNAVAASYNCCLVEVSSANAVITNCTFSRTYSAVSADTYHVSYGGTAGILRNLNNNFLMTGCAVSNNVVRSANTADQYGQPLFNFRTGRVQSCRFEKNHAYYNVKANRHYSMFADPVNGASGAFFSNCVFRANRVTAACTSSTEGAYALSVLGTGTRSSSIKAYDCVFDSNEMVPLAEPPENLAAICSRGVLVPGLFDGDTASVDVRHGTFIGPEDGTYDIVQWGEYHSKELIVRDSLFLTTGSGVAKPFLVQSPGSGSTVRFAPSNCTIQNQTVQPSSEYTVTGLAYDQVPLNADYEPMACTPDLLTTSDGRPRGACPLAAGVDGKKTLTVRREPLEGGSVSAGATQAVAPGAEISAVTATPSEGTSFSGWFDVGGSTPISTLQTLSGLTLTDDRVVVAKFTTRSVRVVYDLEGKGVFATTGTDKFTINTNAGLDFPLCEASFTVNEGWIFVKWHETPAKVPSDVDEVVVTAKIVTTALRAVYLTPTGAGNQDGTSWANAYGNLQSAVDDAAICRGEVWAQEGVYRMSGATALRSNVAIRGGFAGTESSAAEADPVAHETIFTGDYAMDDYWTTNNVKAFNIIANGKIAMPSGDGDSRDVIWRHYYVSTPTGIGFTDEMAETPVTNVCFSGVTIANFYTKAVRLGSGTTAEFDKCRFVANARDDETKAEYVTFTSSGQVVLRDCRFTGNYLAASLGAGSSCTNLVAGCTFEHGRTAYATCGLAISGAARTIVTNCVFRRNCAVGNNFYSAPASALGVGQNVSANLLVNDTVFSKNRAEGTAIATVMIRNGSNAVTFERCRFLENCYGVASSMPTGYNMEVLPGSAGICSLSSSTLTIRDTSFETNVTSVVIPQNMIATVYNNYASAVGVGWGGSVRLLNCAFLGNRLTDGSGGVLPYESGTISSGYSSSGTALAVVNCLFRDNVFSSLSRGPADIALVGSANETATFLNDVLWNTDVGYKPFAFATPVTPQLSACDIRNFDVTAFAEEDQYSYLNKVSTAEPSFSPRNRFRLGGNSVGTRGGTRVYATDSGVWYFKDTVTNPDKPWRKVLDRTSFSESVVGLSNEPLPDMEGVSRLRRVSYGPLNADYPGFTILVR